MYDLSNKFNAFYNTCVVLPQEEQDNLHKLKNKNVERLKSGLKEYNEDHRTSYSVVETCVQGSVAMSTVVQNDDKDYDIDVAVVFEKSDLGDKGPLAVRNIVADALRRKTKQFNAEPEVKTSCVRVKYAEGYHIDFAVFRREWDRFSNKYRYEHAGSEWSERELRGLSDWFKNENDSSNDKLRKVVRLSKMFCKSRDSWVMPSGLLQTVLCDERLQKSYDRIDELFYYTMESIVSRLEDYTTVCAPVDNGRSLTPRKSDLEKMARWKTRLKSKLEDLDVLFKDECTQKDALQAWYGFFNHDYWINQVASACFSVTERVAVSSFADTEQYIEDMYPVKLQYECKVDCYVLCDGWREKPLGEFLSVLRKRIPHNCRVKCVLKKTDCPGSYRVFWKVRNIGPEAERRNMIRGHILERGCEISEPTNFYGNHYIECYIVKDDACVARQRVEIPIGRS